MFKHQCLNFVSNNIWSANVTSFFDKIISIVNAIPMYSGVERAVNICFTRKQILPFSLQSVIAQCVFTGKRDIVKVDKKYISRIEDAGSNWALIHLGRDLQQKNENGYFSLQWRCGSCDNEECPVSKPHFIPKLIQFYLVLLNSLVILSWKSNDRLQYGYTTCLDIMGGDDMLSAVLR